MEQFWKTKINVVTAAVSFLLYGSINVSYRFNFNCRCLQAYTISVLYYGSVAVVGEGVTHGSTEHHK